MNRRDLLYSKYPEQISGYELNSDRGYFSIIVPEATTNLVSNPSFEIRATTGYTAVGGTAAITYDWQAYGVAGVSLTPAALTESGCYYSLSLSAGTTYTFSVTVKGDPNKLYYVWFASSAGSLLGSKRSWRATGRKQRIHVSYTAVSSATHRVYFTRDSQYSDVRPFYADGFQVEAKSYPTTYCDGDRPSFVLGSAGYSWRGAPRASTSTRYAYTRAGGREVSMLSLGLRILAIIGLGMAPVVDQSLPIPGVGQYSQGTGTEARLFSIIGALDSGDYSLRGLQGLRSSIIDAIKPDLVPYDQPIILRYQPTDEDGEVIGESLDITCKYRGGLEGSWDNNQTDRVALQFKMFLPMVENTYESGLDLGYETLVSNFSGIGYRDVDGQWKPMGTGATGGTSSVYSIEVSSKGMVYAGGNFTGMGGVASTAYVALWVNEAWEALGTGANNIVRVLKLGFEGYLYAGGDFTTLGGGAAQAFGYWNGAAWVGGMDYGSPGDAVYDMDIAPDGTIYVVGTDTPQIHRWDGASWVAVGSGVGPAGGTTHIFDLAIGADGKVYIVGSFTSMDGVAVSNIAVWDGATWGPLSTGLNAPGRRIEISPYGTVVVGGTFTQAGGVNALGIAEWNGLQFSPFGLGLGPAASNVYALRWHPVTGDLYAGGDFTSIGNGVLSAARGTFYTLPDGMARWTNGLWTPLDVDIQNATVWILSFGFGTLDRIYVGGYWPPGTTALSATVETPNSGSTETYPVVEFTGPGALFQIRNYTTGQGIYFGGLRVSNNETITLDLNPFRLSFRSSTRGNMLSYIQPGSDLTFRLAPGSNNLSAYLLGGSASSKIIVTWRPMYWSLDGAVAE